MSERVRQVKITVEIDTNKRTITDHVIQDEDETDEAFIERAAAILWCAKERLG